MAVSTCPQAPSVVPHPSFRFQCVDALAELLVLRFQEFPVCQGLSSGLMSSIQGIETFGSGSFQYLGADMLLLDGADGLLELGTEIAQGGVPVLELDAELSRGFMDGVQGVEAFGGGFFQGCGTGMLLLDRSHGLLQLRAEVAHGIVTDLDFGREPGDSRLFLARHCRVMKMLSVNAIG